MPRVSAKTQRQRIFFTATVVAAGVLFFGFSAPAHAAGASLKVAPSAGVYEVGGLVDVSFLIDTGGEAVNAVHADILFPADKLQVVNPAASTSFISIWVTAPTYSNTDGTLTFQGGLPNPGIKTNAGVISTVTFRVKAAGKAAIRYAPTSRVLRNDGEGTDILTATGVAEFTLKNPPPAGPVVTSPTHPDANAWSNNPRVQFSWEAVANATGYSYSFDQNAKGIPNEQQVTTTTTVALQADADGVWYFHVNAKTDLWGGVTTYPVLVDITPPAAFAPKLDQGVFTTEETGTLRFLTTDGASGIDHYEVKQVANAATPGANTLFVESTSPFVVHPLPEGEYQYIVRAYDRAGNYADGTVTLRVIAGGLPFYARTPFFRNPAVANAALFVLLALALLSIGILVVRRLRLRETFRHDLQTLERDAYRKYTALQSELQELREAQRLMGTDTPSPPPPPNTPPPPPYR